MQFTWIQLLKILVLVLSCCALGSIVYTDNSKNLEVSRSGEHVDSYFYEDTDPEVVAVEACRDMPFEDCHSMMVSAIELQQHILFSKPLHNWTYSNICGCKMPPRKQKDILQFLHIPKSGTSFNFLLHDYFNCLTLPGMESDGCEKWLKDADELSQGLCDGRLWSCQGHRAHPHVPDLVGIDVNI